MARQETLGSRVRDAVTSTIAVVGGMAALGGLVALGGREASEVNALSAELNAAARHDGFRGVDTPVFQERAGVASSQLQLGECALRPVIMHYRTKSTGQVDITSYAFEGSAYTEDPHSKRIDALVTDDGMLKATFHNSADLQTMVGEDLCHALEPVLATRNLQLS